MMHHTTDCPPTLDEWGLCGEEYFNFVKPHTGMELDILALAQTTVQHSPYNILQPMQRTFRTGCADYKDHHDLFL